MFRTDHLAYDKHIKCIEETWGRRAVKSIKSTVICKDKFNLKRLLVVLFEGAVCFLDAMVREHLSVIVACSHI